MTTEATILGASAPASGDDDAIRATIDDYYLGWFDADGDRMARALHPELVKRGWLRDPAGATRLNEATFRTMVDAAGAGNGRRTGAAGRQYHVGFVEAYGDVASATVHSVPYVDYLHLVRTSDGWRIVNALWCPAQAT